MSTPINGRFERFKKGNKVPKSLFLSSSLVSLILSISIFTRFFFYVDISLRYPSIIAYVLLFFILPLFASIYTAFKSYEHKNLLWLGVSMFFSFLCCYLMIVAVKIPAISIPEYIFLWPPVPLMLILFAWWNPTTRLRTKKYAFFVALGLLITFLLPNIVVAFSVNSLLNETISINDNSNKASLICARVESMTNYGSAFRAYNNLWEFWLTGVGSCGEMTNAKTQLLSTLGFETRKVFVSGENHEFTEVEIDGEWKVADGSTLVTRREFTNNRIQSIGSLTYVVTLTEDSFIELTQMYVENADVITIRVTKNTEPVPNAKVQLRHTFVMESGPIMQQLPHGDRAFLTDFNGTVILHLGKPSYRDEFKESENFYWVFVNDQNKTRVTSTGTGLIHSPLEIDIG